MTERHGRQLAVDVGPIPRAWAVFGIVGGLLTLIGALLPWISIRTCETSTAMFPVCRSYTPPEGFTIASVNLFLPLASPLALILGTTAVALLFLNRVRFLEIAAVLAIQVCVVSLSFLLLVPPLADEIWRRLHLMGSAGPGLTVSVGLGPSVMLMAGAIVLVAALGIRRSHRNLEGGPPTGSAPARSSPEPSSRGPP